MMGEYDAGYENCIDGMVRQMEDMQFRIDNLHRENAKLRELVAQRTARRVIVSNADTDHATGHTACGACGGAIDPWDAWCRHCGVKLEEDA